MSTKADGPEFLIELATKQGVACATVSDGHVLVFTKEHLKLLLEKVESSNSDKCVVFVKRAEFTN